MKKMIIFRFRQGIFEENLDMKSSDGRQNKNRKWSIKECEDTDGWKLKDVRRKQVKAESLDGAKIMREIYTTNFDNKFDDRYWRVGNIYLIENDKLKTQFEEYKKELIELGRPPNTITETVVFSAESEKSCKDICQDGNKVGSKKRHVLGHTGSGVHLVRHYDILTRYLMFQQCTSPAYILVYKTFLGKTKPIVPRLHKDDNYVPPYSGFDSHVSARHVDKDMPICEALNCSYVYLYEFDQIASNPVKYPRQILPYAVIQLEKKVPSIPENPFLAVGSDETRSTWEVKGETRRGFRFMFTKSGLKGKHRDFTKTLSRKNFGSHLKGQILEMRTKSASSMREAKPPLLQKMDDSSLTDSRKEDSVDTSKPPNLQKYTGSGTQPACKNENCTFGKEFQNIVIPKSVRDNIQFSSFKPCVKLKRLDSSYKLTKLNVKSKLKTEKSNEKTKTINVPSVKSSSSSEHKCPNSDCSSEKEKTNILGSVSGPLTSNTDKTDTSNIGQKSTDTPKSDCKELETNGSGVMDKVNSSNEIGPSKCTVEISKQKSAGAGKCSEPKVNCKQLPKAIKEKSSVRLCTSSDKDGIKTEISIPKDKSAAKTTKSGSDSCHNIKAIRVSPASNTSMETHVSEHNKYKGKSFALNKMLDKTPVPSTVDVTAEKSSSVSKLSCSGVIENQTNACLSPQNLPTESKHTNNGKQDDVETPISSQTGQIKLKAQRSDKKAALLNNKKDNKYCTLKSILKGIPDTLTNEKQITNITTLEKEAPNQRVAKNNKSCGIRNSAESTDKPNVNRRKYEGKKAEFKTLRTNSLLNIEKEKHTKILSARLAPTKTKFGRVVYTISKNKAGTFRKYAYDKNRSGNHSSESRAVKTSNACKEYDFVRNKPCIVENSVETTKNGFESINVPSSRNLSGKFGENELGNANKSESCLAHSEKRKDTFVDQSMQKTVERESCGIEAAQTNGHNQSIVLEKSKSPVIANAAPDLLNISPVLVSAQISTSRYSSCVVSFQNDPLNTERLIEKDTRHEVPEKGQFVFKNNIFLSEMSSFFDNRNGVKALDFVEHFPEPVTQTHVVNPVLRATLGNGIPLKSREETKVPDDKKKKTEKTVLMERKQDCDKSAGYSNPGNEPENTTGTVNTKKSMETKVLGTVTNSAKNIGVSVRSETVPSDIKNKQTFSSQSTADSILCSPAAVTKTQNYETSKPNVPSSLHVPNENNLKSSPCNKTPKLVEAQADITSTQPNGNWLKIFQKNENRDCVKEKQVKDIQLRQTVSSGEKESRNLIKQVGPGQHTDGKIYSGKLEKEISYAEENIGETVKTVKNEETNLDKARRKKYRTSKEKPNTFIPINDKQEVRTVEGKKHSMQLVSQQHGSDKNENNVKVDTLTADRLRSFLSTTAATAIQRKKSVDQKSDTSTDDNSSVVTSLNEPDNKFVKTENDSTFKDSGHEPVQENHETDASVVENKDSASQRTPVTILASKTTERQTQPNVRIKEPRITYIKQQRRRDSAEMHDNDSQDTVIGGVTDVTCLPLRHTRFDSSNENTNLKTFETLLKKFSPKGTHSEVVSNIKQEREDDGYEKQTVTSVALTNTRPYSEAGICPNTLQNDQATYSVKKTLNDDSQMETMTIVNEVKHEPVDEAFDTPNTSNLKENIETHSVKTELCDRSCFFPRTRQELANGAAMLSATECRSAIVDTLRELSSVLKCLTENNISGAKQTGKVALVAKEMCNVLSAEKNSTAVSNTTEVDKTVMSNSHSLFPDSNIKAEPVDTYDRQNQNITETGIQDSKFTLNANMNHSEKEGFVPENCSTSEQKLKYDYILKCSDDEHKRTCENSECLSSVLETTKERQKNEIQNAMPVQHNRKDEQSTVTNEIMMRHQHEIDALPRLFDPSKEPDITFLEEFGIQRELCMNENKTVQTTCVERLPFETSFTADNASVSRHSDIGELLREIKTEKITDESLVKPKQKQALHFKTGLLNKGLKERKNMFDLKITSSRRKTCATVTGKKSAVSLERAKSQMPPTSDCISDEPCTKENQSKLVLQKQHENVHNEVYKTVCEKLLTMKETCDSERTENKSVLSPSATQGSYDVSKSSNMKDPCKDLQPKENISENKEESERILSMQFDKAKVKSTKASALREKGIVKNYPIIPFKTVIQLKKRQYQKYKRGESNKKFIDYNEILPKMNKEKLYKSDEKMSNTPKDRNMPKQESENSFKNHIKKNEHLGKKLNYFIPSCKTSVLSNRGTALIEDNSLSDNVQETDTLKRRSTSADEGTSEIKRAKLSSDETDRNKPRSNRSRSKSSHRSSENGQHRSREHSSPLHSDQHRSSEYSRKNNYGRIRSHFMNKGNYYVKPAYGSSTHMNSKFVNRFQSTQAYRTSNQHNGPFGKSSFNKSGTGYFSWRRKYQPRRNFYEGFVVTNKGSVQTVAEYAEWTRFKERESLRIQIENAIKEYRRTFEHTQDDKQGDEKVASYLNFLTEKLDKIQTKRNKLNMPYPPDPEINKHRRSKSHDNVPSETIQCQTESRSALCGKLEKSQNFRQHETLQHSSVARFSGALASESDSLSYRQRRHASGIEELLREHIEKHCEHLTKQIKQEISEEIKERKTPAQDLKAASTPRKDHTDRPFSKDFDRDKSKYERRYSDDKYRRHSHERYDSKRGSKEREYRRLYDTYEPREDDYDKKYNRDSYDKYDERQYTLYRQNRDSKHERTSHRDTYDRHKDSYRTHHSSEYELHYKNDYYSNSKYSIPFDDNGSIETNSRSDSDRTKYYAKTYDFQQNYDKYQENFYWPYQNTNPNIFRYQYQADNALETGDHTNIYLNSKLYHAKKSFRGKYNKYYNKSSADANYQPKENNGESDKESDEEKVLDEFDATLYRKPTPSNPKRRRGSFKFIKKWKPYKQSYQPAKFSRIRNPPTYFHYVDDDKGKTNSKDAKAASNLKKTQTEGTAVEIVVSTNETDKCKGLSFLKSKEPKSIPILCGARQTTKSEK